MFHSGRTICNTTLKSQEVIEYIISNEGKLLKQQLIKLDKHSIEISSM